MDIIFALSFSSLSSILYAAIGLGFVIFVHELGHFAVAKWCGVRVERFSIGFGPVLWSVVRGDTEYALSAVPFGGYVKMLGQDDVDPNQMTSDAIALDPRSYTAKSVPQRMAIISAGVIMNILTAPLFFAVAFMLGTRELAEVVGTTAPGSPAWVAGVRGGDRITNINGYEIDSFGDISKRVILSGGTVELSGEHDNGEKFVATLVPQPSKKPGSMPAIGVAPARGLTLLDTPVQTGTAAARAEPAFAGGDVIESVDGHAIKTHTELQRFLAEKRGEPVEIDVSRAAEKDSKEKTSKVIKVGPQSYRGLGLRVDIGQIAAIRRGSPAEGKLQIGDKITHVGGESGPQREVGGDLDPLELPDFLAGLHGQAVKLQVQRPVNGTDPKLVEVVLTPDDSPGWIEHPFTKDSPVSAPAIGIAYYVLHDVLAVTPGSAAEGKVEVRKTRIKKLELILPAGAEKDGYEADLSLEFGEDQRNWPYAFWLMQECPQRTAKLTVTYEGTAADPVDLQPAAIEGWYAPFRGMQFLPIIKERKITDPIHAVSLGVAQTRGTIHEIYLTLYNLFTGGLSVKGLHGPLGIAGAAVTLSNEGLSPLLFFLGYLSVNLAVLNFLPIPLLDGGHMVFLMYEGLRGKPANERVLIGATYVGLAFVISLLFFVLYLDIFVHWLKLG